MGETVSFEGSFTDPGTLDTHTTEWDFGDGGTAEGTLTPTHVYSIMGVYTVTLTVTDDDGGVGADTLTVTVECPMMVVSSDSVILEELRRFRDDILAKSETGRRLTDIYYHHSPEVAGILLGNPVLAVRSAAILKDIMPGVRFLLGSRSGRDMVMTPFRAARINRLFANISAQGSEELAQTLSMLSDVLERHKGMRVSLIWRSLQ
jgi:PKD repeat protein